MFEAGLLLATLASQASPAVDVFDAARRLGERPIYHWFPARFQRMLFPRRGSRLNRILHIVHRCAPVARGL